MTEGDHPTMHDDLLARGQLPGLAPMRMLRSLWRTGWTNDALAKHCGIPPRSLDAILDGQEQVPEEHVETIAQTWTVLRGIPGASWRAIAQGDQLGWPPAYELTLELAGLADCPLLARYPRMDATRPTGGATSRTEGPRTYPGAVKLRERTSPRYDQRKAAPGK